jgi:hypothetical protein
LSLSSAISVVIGGFSGERLWREFAAISSIGACA